MSVEQQNRVKILVLVSPPPEWWRGELVSTSSRKACKILHQLKERWINYWWNLVLLDKLSAQWQFWWKETEFSMWQLLHHFRGAYYNVFVKIIFNLYGDKRGLLSFVFIWFMERWLNNQPFIEWTRRWVPLTHFVYIMVCCVLCVWCYQRELWQNSSSGTL